MPYTRKVDTYIYVMWYTCDSDLIYLHCIRDGNDYAISDTVE